MTGLLDRQLDELANCPPSGRIGMRDDILAFGVECVAPLVALVATRPDLASSVASWLEVLANRDPGARTASLTALRRLAAAADGAVARQALERLNTGSDHTASAPRARSRTPRVRRDAGAEVHARLLVAAKAGRRLTYGELETSRGHVGKYLHRIALVEAEAGHPPLTAIVVSKTTGRPGDGFMPAMLEVGFAQTGERPADVWRRALTAVEAYWIGKP